MKILHTSDWHLGQEFYSYNRIEEHEAFLLQLEEIVRKEQPDVLVVSGDIYHNATPSNAVMRMFTDGLDRICRACPSMQVVVTAGNHDSSSRLEVTRSLWNRFGVYIVGRIEKTDNQVNFDKHIIGINDASGKRCGYVVALPHVFAHAYPLVEGAKAENRQEAFYAALAKRVREVNVENLPVVMMAHMAVTGSDITGHDDIRGGMEYVELDSLKVDFDYLALGHIHCPQLLGAGRARYCGSPVPVSFDERYEHSVTMVELQHKGEVPVLRYLPIKNPWPLRTIPSEAVPFEEALPLLQNFPADEQAYIRLQVKLEDVPPHNALERACMAMEGKKARFCCFKWEQRKQKAAAAKVFADVEQIKAQSPLQIAELYYHNRFGVPMEKELCEMLNQVIEETKGE